MSELNKSIELVKVIIGELYGVQASTKFVQPYYSNYLLQTPVWIGYKLLGEKGKVKGAPQVYSYHRTYPNYLAVDSLCYSPKQKQKLNTTDSFEFI